MPDAFVRRAAIAAFCAVVFALVFAKSMNDGLNHDEHQFLAPAALIGQFGLQPYRDFPLFHLPVLTLIYALFYECEYPFLLARLFNVLCATGMVCLVFAFAWRKFAAWPFLRRFGVAAGFASLILFTSLFIETSGKTWNHDLPVLLTVTAIWLHACASKAITNWQLAAVGASGLCIGLATGARLTYAPLAAPFLAAIFLFPQVPLKRKLALAAVFSVAVLLALAPVIWSFCQAPQQFMFGNFEFPRLRLLDPSDTRAQKTAKLWRKLRYFFKEITLSNPAVFGAFIFAAVPVLFQNLRSRATRDFESMFFVLLIPFVLFGCLAPTRYQYQHFYVVAPLFVMATVHALSTREWRLPRALFIPALCLVGLALGARGYRGIAKIGRVEEWFPIQCHARGMEIRNRAGQGKVMTFAPIYPLEAGMAIYPEFATGPFAMRLAHLVPTERRKKMHLVSRDDLPEFLRADPPVAILLGFEPPALEQPLRDFAQQNGYTLAHKRKAVELWTAGRDGSPSRP